MTPEKAIENDILLFLSRAGVFAFKLDRQGTFDPKKKVFRMNKNPWKIKGVSDILCIIQGRFVAIEVKSPTGQLSQHQRTFLARVNNEGGIGFVARSVESVAQELSRHFPGFREAFERLAYNGVN
jgi:penicillin-binding protein-related factor A (putative recombinase)